MTFNGVQVDESVKNTLIKNIEKYYKEKNDGHLLRSKIKWTNEGEKSTKFFSKVHSHWPVKYAVTNIKDRGR